MRNADDLRQEYDRGWSDGKRTGILTTMVVLTVIVMLIGVFANFYSAGWHACHIHHC